MLRQLRSGNVRGVVIHKIDRSARNLKDWADLGELIDSGVEVHFANESLDLNTRGGRLSADIQAVVAADYIRNLREETKKGFYGRLKQGLYPLPAPIGYLDLGKGKLKEPDPLSAPFVARLFELYSTGQYSLHRLLAESEQIGLRNRFGKALTLTGLSTVLNNPFYMGLVRVRRTGEVFPGNHQPLIAKSLFDRVQSILRGKTVTRIVRHNFPFRKIVRCGRCGHSLIGELQKGHVYYRCQTRQCPTKTVREEIVDNAVASQVAALKLDEEELLYVKGWEERVRVQENTHREQELQSSRLRLDGTRNRLSRLTDAFIDGVLEKPLFEERKAGLLHEEKAMRETISQLEAGNGESLRELERFLELVRNAPFAYENAGPDEKRDLVKSLFSNLSLIDKNVGVMLKPSVELVTNRREMPNGAPSQGVHRTWDGILKKLLKQFDTSGVKTPPDMPVQALKAAA
jgi:hypothetical protein